MGEGKQKSDSYVTMPSHLVVTLIMHHFYSLEITLFNGFIMQGAKIYSTAAVLMAANKYLTAAAAASCKSVTLHPPPPFYNAQYLSPFSPEPHFTSILMCLGRLLQQLTSPSL